MASRGVDNTHSNVQIDPDSRIHEIVDSNEMSFSVNGASANDRAAMSLQPESNPFDYRCCDHPIALLQAFNQLYHSQSLTDVTLSAGELTFVAHRVVLAAGSPYFNAMFNNAHIESTQNHIVLNDIDGESLGLLLEFIYSAKLSITETNVQNLLAAASLLQITPIVEACCEFLLVRLDPDNCLGICTFADVHGCTSLQTVSWEYALQHFCDTSKAEEFLSMPAILLEKLLRSESLQVQSEENVLDAALLWYQHDAFARHEAFVNLLHYIKLPLIPYSVLNQRLLTIPVLINDNQCMKLLASAKAYQNTKQPVSVPSDFNPYAARKSMFHRQLIYVVGGEIFPGRSMTDTVDEYNPIKNIWTKLQPMSISRRGVGVCILNGLLYAIGGSDGLQALSLVECYNPGTNAWTRVADLNENRSSVAVVVVNDVLYAVGGYDGVMNCLCSVEQYNLATNTWTYVQSMNIPRSMVSVGVAGKHMYVVGGYDGGSDLSSCEVFDIESNTWTIIESMHFCRCMAGVGVVDNLLYAIGGCDCAKSLSSVEVYNMDKKVWTIAPEMMEARSGLGIAVIGQCLYAIGGYTGSNYCESIEKYDTAIGQWTKVEDMSLGRRRFGCCS